MAVIYGVDTEKPVTPVMVRDAIVRCFILAHKNVLEGIAKYPQQMSNHEFDEFKKLDVEILIRRMFKEVGGDYNKPEKQSIIKVIQKLKIYAANFRNPEIIQKHASEITRLVDKL